MNSEKYEERKYKLRTYETVGESREIVGIRKRKKPGGGFKYKILEKGEGQMRKENEKGSGKRKREDQIIETERVTLDLMTEKTNKKIKPSISPAIERMRKLFVEKGEKDEVEQNNIENGESEKAQGVSEIIRKFEKEEKMRVKKILKTTKTQSLITAFEIRIDQNKPENFQALTNKTVRTLKGGGNFTNKSKESENLNSKLVRGGIDPQLRQSRKKNNILNGDPVMNIKKTPVRGKKKGGGSPRSWDIRRFMSGGSSEKVGANGSNFTPKGSKIIVETKRKVVMTSQGGGQEVSQGIKFTF